MSCYRNGEHRSCVREPRELTQVKQNEKRVRSFRIRPLLCANRSTDDDAFSRCPGENFSITLRPPTFAFDELFATFVGGKFVRENGHVRLIRYGKIALHGQMWQRSRYTKKRSERTNKTKSL